MGDFFIHYFINNWLTISILIGLIIIAVGRQNMNKQTGTLFILASCSCLICSFFSYLDIYYGADGTEQLNILRVIGSLVAYAMKPLPSIFVLNFILKIRTKQDKIVFSLLTIPAVINVIVCMLSFKFGEYLVCYFTPDNHWHGGTLSLFPSIVGYFYLAVITGICIYRAIRRDFEEVFAVLFMVLIIIIACVFEFMVGTDDFIIPESSIINGTTAIGLTFIYFHVYVTKNEVDTITGLHNRSAYYYDLQKYKQQITAVISIDMNNLKEINDNEGHNAGDLALETIGIVIKEHINRNKAYRIGGDEFAIICFKTDINQVKTLVEELKTKILEKGIFIAGGYCMVDESNSLALDDAIKIADSRMYRDKREIKKALGKNIYRNS